MLKKLKKLIYILVQTSPLLIRGLVNGVYASIEHGGILRKHDYSLVVDVGANRGQFALACRLWCPNALIFSIEPLSDPANVFSKFFKNDENVSLQIGAVGANFSTAIMHVSQRDDSSSLLSISSLQIENFPGTQESSTSSVNIAPLDYYVTKDQINGKALLKIDVQGYEFDVLVGSESLLHKFQHIYCECSFIELYSGQKLAHQIIDFLNKKNFILSGIYNIFYDKSGKAIQGDMFFENLNPIN
jgi:FkbM family methyltransferase